MKNVRYYVELSLAPLAVFISIIAYFLPVGFVWMKPHIPVLLGIIMFGMGMTLEFEDFARVLKKPKFLFTGVFAQYGFMPLLGFLIGWALQLDPALTAGIILLGACPGGTASNVVAYLARANVGLSVSLTLLSTLLSPILTPVITWFYANQVVDVDMLQLMKNVFWIVLFPLLDGLLLRVLFRKYIEPVLDFFPLLSAAIILAVIGCVVALNADKLGTISLWVVAAVILHNAGGLALGYATGRCISGDKATCRTLALEVGMQNSGLAVSLAIATPAFGASAAIPSAIFSLWHNLTGLYLAGRWSKTADT